MIFVLVPLRWRNAGAPAPSVFVPADVFSYHHSPAEISTFLSPDPFMPLESFPEPPPFQPCEADPVLVTAPDEVSVFVSDPEVSEFVGGDG